MDLDCLRTMHEELDYFAKHAKVSRSLVFTGSYATYDFREVMAWPEMKRALADRLREEKSAAVSFWDSNQVCWSSSRAAVDVYEAYNRGFFMLREQLPMPIVYVAGPFSAKTRAGVEENIRRAEALALKVAELGTFPVAPHCNTSHPDFERVQPYDFWICGTLKLLRVSDAIILTDDWERSSGARGERTEAERRGMPVFETIEELKAWVEAIL